VDGGPIVYNSSSATPGHGRIVVENNIVDNQVMTLYRAPNYTSYSWYRADNNVLSTGAAGASTMSFNGLYTSLAQRRAQTGNTDAASLTTITPAFADRSADLGTYAASLGSATTEDAFVAVARVRGLAVFNARNDMM